MQGGRPPGRPTRSEAKPNEAHRMARPISSARSVPGRTGRYRSALREIGVIHATPDQPPVRCLLRGQLVTQHCESGGACIADQTWKEPGGTAIRYQSETAECLDKHRRARRNHDVAGERDAGARPRGNAIDRRDDRHRQVAQCEYQRLVVSLNGFPEIYAPAAGHDHAVAKVLPRAKSATRTGQHQHSRAVINNLRQRAPDFLVHRGIQAVQPIRSVQGQPRNVVCHRILDRGVIHLHSGGGRHSS